ncbi:MAG: hypothetical protein HOJ48_19390 [Desulfobacula sp.]|jgi:hypothetical protein|nr:hypothetical protein [Desulfobacula sp.]MBT7260699.1 hypothetical protein [Desulfobacula sp.]
MDQVSCLCCGRLFTPRNKNQNYCSSKKCQKTRKADWQRHKIKTDPDYKRDQLISQNKWLSANPDYWKNYRSNNPEKAERNRALQRLRNRKRVKYSQHQSKSDIAKMDVRTQSSMAVNSNLTGQFWMMPVIAKMDATKVFLRVVSKGY